jgi:hypothetical protein
MDTEADAEAYCTRKDDEESGNNPAETPRLGARGFESWRRGRRNGLRGHRFWGGFNGFRFHRDVEGEKNRNVGADRQLDHQLALVGGVVIVLREAFADFAGGDAHDGVGIRIIAWLAAENLDADATLFEVRSITEKGLLDDIGEQSGIAFTVREERVREEADQLLSDGCRVRDGDRLLQILHGFRRYRHVPNS